jgi:hypothetical protein
MHEVYVTYELFLWNVIYDLKKSIEKRMPEFKTVPEDTTPWNPYFNMFRSLDWSRFNVASDYLNMFSVSHRIY